VLSSFANLSFFSCSKYWPPCETMHPFKVFPPVFAAEEFEVSLLEPDCAPGVPELLSAPGPPPVDPEPPIEGPPGEPPVDPAPPAPAPPPEPPAPPLCAAAASDSNNVTVIINMKLVILFRMVLLLRLSP
jgi:hypothetical protein